MQGFMLAMSFSTQILYFFVVGIHIRIPSAVAAGVVFCYFFCGPFGFESCYRAIELLHARIRRWCRRTIRFLGCM